MELCRLGMHLAIGTESVALQGKRAGHNSACHRSASHESACHSSVLVTQVCLSLKCACQKSYDHGEGVNSLCPQRPQPCEYTQGTGSCQLAKGTDCKEVAPGTTDLA